MTCQHSTHIVMTIGPRTIGHPCGHEAPWFCSKDREPKCITHSHTEPCCRPLAREGA